MADCSPDECRNRGPRGGRCQRCRRRDHYRANREHELATMAAWRERNHAYDRERQRAYYNENPERWAARYQAERDERLAQKAEQRAANPGGETHYTREWRQRNPERWAQRNRANQRRRRGLIDREAIIAEHGMVCHICREPIATRDELELDHVIPLIAGGPHTPDNIRPAHALCNLRKGTKLLT